ncbi:Proto-oncogene tyrosine-protein kinase ROS, partial [Armadillidium vulgare]
IKWSIRNKVSGHLGFLTSARELKIDSFRGFLYWRTRHQVFKSSLTGKNLTEIHRENILSEKIVYGLALDANKSELWWIVKNSKEYHLYRKYKEGLDTNENVVQKAMEKGAKEGSLFYLSERLLWVTEGEEIIIYDTILETSATITSSKVNIHFIALQLRPAYSPKELDSLGFLPEAIEFSSVRTDGDWEDFFITWNAVPSPPLQQLNSKLIHKIPENFYGDLRYYVTITGESEKGVYVTKENRLKVPFFVDPYSPLTVSIKGITNWGESEATIVKLRSPSSTPSKPHNIRAFINVSK